MNVIDRVKNETSEISKSIAQERDEIKLKAHLFGMEAKDEWVKLEEKYSKLKESASKIQDVADESVDKLEAAFKKVQEEISTGYKRIKDSLRDSD